MLCSSVLKLESECQTKSDADAQASVVLERMDVLPFCHKCSLMIVAYAAAWAKLPISFSILTACGLGFLSAFKHHS